MKALGNMEVKIMDPKVIIAKVITVITEAIMEMTLVTMVTIIQIVSIRNQPMMSTKQLNNNFWLTKLQTKDMIKKHSATT
jgi:hypothetical protein